MKIKKREARRIAMTEFFRSAKKPVSFKEVLTRFGINDKSLRLELTTLRNQGINIRSSMKYLSLREKFNTGREVRQKEMIQFFQSAEAPVPESDVLNHFEISKMTLRQDLLILRKQGVNIYSRMKHYSIKGKFAQESFRKLRLKKVKPSFKKNKIPSKRNVIVDWQAVNARFEAIKKETKVKISSRYNVETDFGESFTGRLVFLRDGVYGFNVDGDYKTARDGKCKLTLEN